jgi:hypothetical protein
MSHELDTRHVLDDLVQQFADPFAFFRELIQNAIDAGSLEVEVAFEWEPGHNDDVPGRLTIHIEDWGEGMNREIIENKLTRLFSSGKDDDFTKIGKFGIGFVSVFAIRPDAVCVDTGRGGENWRVLFGPDRSWQLIELDQPLEGTQIRVFKTLESKAEMEEFVARSRSVIRQWCRHVEVPIRIEGQDVREPFVVPDALVSTRYDEEGTRIVAAVVDQPVAPFGFYNRGLLLQEGRESQFPFIGFKIDSRYLEHTLTRDQVVRDKHFDKAMSLITRVIEEDLPAAVLEGLEQAARNGDQAAYERHVRAARNMSLRVDRDAEIFPLLDGSVASLGELLKASKRRALYVAEEPDVLTSLLSKDERVRIVHARAQGVLHKFLRAQDCSASPHGTAQSAVEEVDAGQFPGGHQLLSEVESLLRGMGGAPQWVGFGTVGPTSRLKHPLVPLVDRRAVIAHGSFDPPAVSSLVSATNVVIEPTTDTVKAALKLVEHEPELAAYQLVKIAALATGLDPADDTILATEAVKRREARLGGAA